MTLGQIAYEAYFKSVGGRSAVSGGRLPTWWAQAPNIRQAWEEAGKAVEADVVKRGVGE